MPTVYEAWRAARTDLPFNEWGDSPAGQEAIATRDRQVVVESVPGAIWDAEQHKADQAETRDREAAAAAPPPEPVPPEPARLPRRIPRRGEKWSGEGSGEN